MDRVDEMKPVAPAVEAQERPSASPGPSAAIPSGCRAPDSRGTILTAPAPAHPGESGAPTLRSVRDLPEHGRWQGVSWEIVRTAPARACINLAMEEVLSDAVARGERGPTLRFWGWTESCAVLGRFQSVRNELDVEAAKERGVAVVRRLTGGGTMLIEPSGAVTYSIHAPETLVAGMDFIESYRFLDSWAVAALRSAGMEAWYRPVNDIACSRGKIAGAAQARRKGVVLHHATMAYDMDMDLLRAVLRTGKPRLNPTGIASAVKVVAPLRLQTARSRESVEGLLLSWFRDEIGGVERPPERREEEEAFRLARAKYADPSWTLLLP